MEKYKDRIALSFGCVEICDFPTPATAFEQYPSGRLIINDLYGSELVYYRLKVSARIRNRNSKHIRFDDFKTEMVNTINEYFAKLHGQPVHVHGYPTMYRYLNWLLNPNGRYMGQKPGARIEPINSSIGGYQIYIEFPNLIFFHMHDRVVCRDPKNHEAPTQTFYSRNYAEISTDDVNADTVGYSYPRDGFFGVMRFAGQPYFFSLQVADLPRWNAVANFRSSERPVWHKDKLLSSSLNQDDVGIILHREILKRFTFFRFGTLDKPTDIKVFFPLPDRLNEKPAEYSQAELIETP